MIVATALALTLGHALADAPPPDFRGTTMTLTKSPTCSCCDAYADVLRQAGAGVTIEVVDDIAQHKHAAGVPTQLWSCHTLKIDDYVVEGHVPLSAIARLLATGPAVTGIALPGMPAGSPGMPGTAPAAGLEVLSFGPVGVTEFGVF
ncbi:MAG: DUF411 domain-containing protein [Trueperaceae bacterium]